VVEEKIGGIASVLLEVQNSLGISPEVTLKLEKLGGGHHNMKYDFWGVGSQLAKDVQPPLKALMENEVFWLDHRNYILWNEEVGKWSLLLQK
jgi:hypothetical protein